jgi:NAD(P)H-flavin reductase
VAILFIKVNIRERRPFLMIMNNSSKRHLILTIYVESNETSKYAKQKLIKQQRKRRKYKITLGNFNFPFLRISRTRT